MKRRLASLWKTGFGELLPSMLPMLLYLQLKNLNQSHSHRHSHSHRCRCRVVDRETDLPPIPCGFFPAGW